MTEERVAMPREADESMIRAACAVDCDACYNDCLSGPYAAYYRAMVADWEARQPKEDK